MEGLVLFQDLESPRLPKLTSLTWFADDAVDHSWATSVTQRTWHFYAILVGKVLCMGDAKPFTSEVETYIDHPPSYSAK